VLIFAPWHTTNGTAIWGAVAILGATLSYGIGAVYMSRHLIGRGIPPVALTAAQLLLATGFTAVATPVAGLQPVRVDPIGLLAVVVLGVFGTGIAFVLYNRLIADEGATTATTVAYLTPVVSVLLGALVLGEQITLRVVAGIAIVFAGLALTRRAPRPAMHGTRAVAEPVKTG
jgi:drug/metabolite transporter (DMT)-like permease